MGVQSILKFQTKKELPETQDHPGETTAETEVEGMTMKEDQGSPIIIIPTGTETTEKTETEKEDIEYHFNSQ